MSTNAEITYAIQNDRPSITIRLSAQEEGKNKPDLRDMLSQIQEAITEYQANKPQAKLLANDEVDVQNVPVLNRKTSTSKARAFQPGPVEKITEKQLYCIKESLGKRNLDETAFCQAYGVNHLEDLPKSVATDIVSEIKRKP